MEIGINKFAVCQNSLNNQVSFKNAAVYAAILSTPATTGDTFKRQPNDDIALTRGKLSNPAYVGKLFAGEQDSSAAVVDKVMSNKKAAAKVLSDPKVARTVMTALLDNVDNSLAVGAISPQQRQHAELLSDMLTVALYDPSVGIFNDKSSNKVSFKGLGSLFKFDGDTRKEKAIGTVNKYALAGGILAGTTSPVVIVDPVVSAGTTFAMLKGVAGLYNQKDSKRMAATISALTKPVRKTCIDLVAQGALTSFADPISGAVLSASVSYGLDQAFGRSLIAALERNIKPEQILSFADEVHSIAEEARAARAQGNRR